MVCDALRLLLILAWLTVSLIVPKACQISDYASAVFVDYVCDIPRRVFDIQCAGSWLDFRQYPNVLFLRFCF